VFAQDVTINFTGVANTSVQSLDSYAGYYTGTVNGVAEAPGFICDDYNNEIFLPGESWQATAASFASLATMSTATLDSRTLFGNTIGLDGYAAIANLSTQMATASPAQQANLSAAIWYIGSLHSASVVPWGSLTAAQQTLVNQMIALYGSFSAGSDGSAALAELENSSLWLYTPTGAGIIPTSDPFPQEFVGNVAVPEGGASFMFMLLAGGSCFGAMFFKRRKQLTVSRNLEIA
jgi:hypothetical protein